MSRLILTLVSVLFVSSNVFAADPTRVHKDDYMSFCMSKRDSKAYCKCTMKAVDADIAKRKTNMEKILKNEKANTEKGYKHTISLALRKRVVKDEAEIHADCDIMRGHAEGKISDAKYSETFSGRKAGFYVDRLKSRVCFANAADDSKTAELYNKKDYEYVNASYIMTADNQCRREHLN